MSQLARAAISRNPLQRLKHKRLGGVFVRNVAQHDLLQPLSMALLAGLTGYAVQAGVNIAQAPGIMLFFVLLSSLDLSSRPDEAEEDD